MAKLLKRRWAPSDASGLPRRDRQGCDYEAYVPDILVGRSFAFDGATAADVADAEAAITRLNLHARGLVDSEAVARLLLRAEAVASSKIEGLEVGGRRLLKAQVARASGHPGDDVTAAEVLKNIDAMAWAIAHVSTAETITVDHILGIHERLLSGTRLHEHAGKIRTEQNWIGGSSYNPCRAAFVPPPHGQVEELLQDLVAFCNIDDLPTVAQAAIAHTQFETIHPFVDGNGRAGRALIHVVLRRRGLAPNVLPPVSLVLATWSTDYIDALTGTRYSGSATSRAAIDGLNRWVALFASATSRAVSDAEAYEEQVEQLQDTWRERLGKMRAGSAVELLIEALPGAPIITAQSAAQLTGRTLPAANSAVSRLVDAGILKQTTVGKRNRAFEAPELIDAFTDLERQLASPDADTRSSPPARRVPQSRSRTR